MGEKICEHGDALKLRCDTCIRRAVAAERRAILRGLIKLLCRPENGNDTIHNAAIYEAIAVVQFRAPGDCEGAAKTKA